MSKPACGHEPRREGSCLECCKASLGDLREQFQALVTSPTAADTKLMQDLKSVAHDYRYDCSNDYTSDGWVLLDAAERIKELTSVGLDTDETLELLSEARQSLYLDPDRCGDPNCAECHTSYLAERIDARLARIEALRGSGEAASEGSSP